MWSLWYKFEGNVWIRLCESERASGGTKVEGEVEQVSSYSTFV